MEDHLFGNKQKIKIIFEFKWVKPKKKEKPKKTAKIELNICIIIHLTQFMIYKNDNKFESNTVT